MKKITILIAFVFATSAFGQKTSKDYKFFEESNQNTEGEAAKAGEYPGTPGGDPSPIDNYIPVLVLIGLGMAVYFGRKKYSIVK